MATLKWRPLFLKLYELLVTILITDLVSWNSNSQREQVYWDYISTLHQLWLGIVESTGTNMGPPRPTPSSGAVWEESVIYGFSTIE